MQLGLLLTVMGMIFIILSLFLGQGKDNVKTEVAVGGFIGFIPFGFATNKKMLLTVLLISAVMLLIFLLFQRFK